MTVCPPPLSPCRVFMENVCDRMLELDGGKAIMHNFGGAGSYLQYREVGGCVLDPGWG